jgi:hypothetical protein
VTDFLKASARGGDGGGCGHEFRETHPRIVLLRA